MSGNPLAKTPLMQEVDSEAAAALSALLASLAPAARPRVPRIHTRPVLRLPTPTRDAAAHTPGLLALAAMAPLLTESNSAALALMRQVLEALPPLALFLSSGRGDVAGLLSSIAASLGAPLALQTGSFGLLAHALLLPHPTAPLRACKPAELLLEVLASGVGWPVPHLRRTALHTLVLPGQARFGDERPQKCYFCD
eukprot:TRINITY_DN3052_c0_g5_i1.p1 TRINITY_DN3052_c0_g5~~TRINITY_DN3052_c0_g5_i1.p1  ORF type:complete len:217 (-),score=34.38 TRINITY_DN3052_c0_g5_i1:601-1188(-)